MPRYNIVHTYESLNRLAEAIETEAKQLRRAAARMAKEGVGRINVYHHSQVDDGLDAFAEFVSEADRRVNGHLRSRDRSVSARKKVHRRRWVQGRIGSKW